MSACSVPKNLLNEGTTQRGSNPVRLDCRMPAGGDAAAAHLNPERAAPGAIEPLKGSPGRRRRNGIPGALDCWATGFAEGTPSADWPDLGVPRSNRPAVCARRSSANATRMRPGGRSLLRRTCRKSPPRSVSAALRQHLATDPRPALRPRRPACDNRAEQDWVGSNLDQRLPRPMRRLTGRASARGRAGGPGRGRGSIRGSNRRPPGRRRPFRSRGRSSPQCAPLSATRSPVSPAPA